MLHFHHLNACMMPWSDGIWHPVQSRCDPIHGLWCQINSDTHHTINHRPWSHSQGTRMFGHRAWYPHVTEEVFVWLRAGSCLISWWPTHMHTLCDWWWHSCMVNMCLVMITNKWWNKWNGEANASPNCICGPGDALVPCAWSICVGVFRRTRAEPVGLVGTCGQLSSCLAVIWSNLVLCKWKTCNFILGFSWWHYGLSDSVAQKVCSERAELSCTYFCYQQHSFHPLVSGEDSFCVCFLYLCLHR